MSLSKPELIVVHVPEGSRAVFTLAPETDKEQGEIDLTGMLEILITDGLKKPTSSPENGVPFGTFSTEGDLAVLVDGKALTDEQIAEAACSGFVNAIRAAIEHAGVLSPAEEEPATTDPLPEE